MRHVLTYLCGLGIIAAFLGYMVLVNWIDYKIHGKVSENPFAVAMMPILILFALVPYVIGVEVLG